MQRNRLGFATAVLLGLVGLTFYQLTARRQADEPPEQTQIELPDLTRDDIDELELSSPEHEKVRLVKQDDEWWVKEPVEALADQGAVDSALTKLDELEATGVAATNPKNHARLEVDEEKGTRVVAKSDGEVLLDGYVGVYQSGSSMLRLHGQDKVATVQGSIRYAFAKKLSGWRDRTITDFEPKDVQEIVFTNQHGKFHFQRDGEDWKQVVARGKKAIAPLDLPKVRGLVGTAAGLNAVDFAAPDVTPEQAGLGEDAATAWLRLGGDAGVSEVLYRIGAEKDKNYYVQREGDPTLYLVSAWIRGRLVPERETFIKKEDDESEKQGEPRLGSAQNPIQVNPVRSAPGAPPAN